jgi:hypothetical protein
MIGDRKWRPNPGKKAEARNPNAMVYLRFRNGLETDAPVRAGGYNWLDRNWAFDITHAAPAD